MIKYGTKLKYKHGEETIIVWQNHFQHEVQLYFIEVHSKNIFIMVSEKWINDNFTAEK